MLIVKRDALWIQKAEEVMKIQALRKKYEEMENKAIAELKSMSEHASSQGGLYRFIKSFRKGSIDYAAIPELQFIDVEQYRKADSIMWKLSMGLEE